MRDNDDLRVQVLAALPANVIHLLNRIETYTGRRLEFRFNDRPPPLLYPSAAASRISEDRACVLLRENAPIVPQDVLHELLHIERYWIERVPQTEPILSHASNWDITGRIENALEHLVIVPREEVYGFGPREAWNHAARTEWGGYPWPKLPDEFSRRLGALLGWVMCQTIPDSEVQSLAKDCLTKERMWDAAERLERDAWRYIGTNKPKAVLSVLRAVRLPRSEFRLAYLNPTTGKKTLEKVPVM